ncbi:hypothetical protein E3Q22_00877 [Wallemia mellicola]|uniref:Inhibitor I9 domain-containing protein n=1 Tax=Wallemia mellicola TaxID=1708541 RepID=A0A4T0LVH7_9BASI|nr:hypothetical protein E3Q24_00819 [Wallemia mellicola]TIB78051.1 hypothetical protein E3Q23_01006 [Wallemia mellicola]TIB81620.1 hypothetical protein E3Q22_00877 [Wallemia mellicola]TIB90986.1 hypothetical protein E3Q21_00052 [Wallemia mellicola]TIB92654.1 hypothetical protein E3Q20_00052 [Wallemia mellicola]
MTEQHERYIVVFKDSASDAEIKNYAQEVESGGGKIVHHYNPDGIMKSFAGHIPQNVYTSLSAQSGQSPIDFIEKDKEMKIQ